MRWLLESGRVKFYAAVYVRNVLAEHLDLAEDDLLQAAGYKPMYGALHVIRYCYRAVS